ncbi:polysaccharide deacetylase family protein [Cytobacillus sp. S13-E01]|uniref:polysaccharide deacetylase family protein n=1 Tax=Cytobacillus sp. S13-E01 TaxID=3031326 RepID=UPI0023D8437A|nr:polysaccharide deacetylase family protein [Cytobacillus sp. S13-E01]MDF0725536.1 polysaccharide deacetylase family protein [Cytobacillus sp. S13-E01]
MVINRVVYDSTDSNVVTTVKTQHKKSVVLTFDDGPSKLLPRILDVLYAENVPATFFWQSKLLFAERPWERVLSESHEIGTHSTKHLNLTNLTYDKQFHDIANSVTHIENITKKKVKFFRPPFGQYNTDTISVAKALHLTPIMWKIASLDWELKNEPEKIITNVTDHLEDGAIILLHELKQTADVLPELIKEIKGKGYHFTGL